MLSNLFKRQWISSPDVIRIRFRWHPWKLNKSQKKNILLYTHVFPIRRQTQKLLISFFFVIFYFRIFVNIKMKETRKEKFVNIFLPPQIIYFFSWISFFPVNSHCIRKINNMHHIFVLINFLILIFIVTAWNLSWALRRHAQIKCVTNVKFI